MAKALASMKLHRPLDQRPHRSVPHRRLRLREGEPELPRRAGGAAAGRDRAWRARARWPAGCRRLDPRHGAQEQCGQVVDMNLEHQRRSQARVFCAARRWRARRHRRRARAARRMSDERRRQASERRGADWHGTTGSAMVPDHVQPRSTSAQIRAGRWSRMRTMATVPSFHRLLRSEGCRSSCSRRSSAIGRSTRYLPAGSSRAQSRAGTASLRMHVESQHGRGGLLFSSLLRIDDAQQRLARPTLVEGEAGAGEAVAGRERGAPGILLRVALAGALEGAAVSARNLVGAQRSTHGDLGHLGGRRLAERMKERPPRRRGRRRHPTSGREMERRPSRPNRRAG